MHRFTQNTKRAIIQFCKQYNYGHQTKIWISTYRKSVGQDKIFYTFHLLAILSYPPIQYMQEMWEEVSYFGKQDMQETLDLVQWASLLCSHIAILYMQVTVIQPCINHYQPRQVHVRPTLRNMRKLWQEAIVLCQMITSSHITYICDEQLQYS